jgi:hypothetical protein
MLEIIMIICTASLVGINLLLFGIWRATLAQSGLVNTSNVLKSQLRADLGNALKTIKGNTEEMKILKSTIAKLSSEYEKQLDRSGSQA